MTISPETAAYWYLRLNGFLAVRHTMTGPRSVRAGADGLLIGVRFPYRVAKRDDPRLNLFANDSLERPTFLLLEAHAGPCALTAYWTDRRGKAMENLLAEVGVLGGTNVLRTGACDALHVAGQFAHTTAIVSLATMGSEISPDVTERFPAVPQFVWSDVLPQLHAKIVDSEAALGREPWWDPEGLLLWRRALTLDVDSFVSDLSERWSVSEVPSVSAVAM